MATLLATLVERVVERTLTDLADGLVAVTPRLVTAVIIFVLALVGITLINLVVRRLLGRVIPDDEALVIDLVVVLVSIFLWFGVALALLKVLGLDEVAASVGTAIGFIALGISYALSEMIEDTVAGVYLLRDPDFNLGDTVEAGDVTGEIVAIGLRKSRFRTEDGDVTVLANRNVESAWTLRTDWDATAA